MKNNLPKPTFLTPLILLVIALFLLQGCIAYEEGKEEFDIVFGENYVPPIDAYTEKVPGRILFLPQQSSYPDQYWEYLIQSFRSEFKSRQILTPRDYNPKGAIPQRSQVYRWADEYKCETVLYVKFTQQSPYPPLRIVADVVLQDVNNEMVLWKGSADYNSTLRPVSNSARRYFQKELKRTQDPDKSLMILENNLLFSQFVGWHLGVYLDFLASSSSQEAPEI